MKETPLLFDSVEESLTRAYGEGFGRIQAAQWERFIQHESLSAADKLIEQCGLDDGEYVVDDRVGRCSFCMGTLRALSYIERGEDVVYCSALCDLAGESVVSAFSPRRLVMDAIFALVAHHSSSDWEAIDILRNTFRDAPAVAMM